MYLITTAHLDSVGVEAKHPERLKEGEAAPVRVLGGSQKSGH